MGVTSQNSFTFYFKNPTHQKQTLNLFKLGSKDNPTIKSNAFFQDGYDNDPTLVMDISFSVDRVEISDSGGYLVYIKDTAEIQLDIYDNSTATKNTEVFNVSGNNTTIDDIYKWLGEQHNVFAQQGYVLIDTSGATPKVQIASYWATNSVDEYATYLKYGVMGFGQASIGQTTQTTPIGLAPVVSNNMTSTMVQISGGQGYPQIDNSQGSAPMDITDMSAYSQNSAQLQNCIVFTRRDSNGNMIGTAECPTIDPYQSQNQIRGIDTSDVIFDGDTKMSYDVEALTTSINTFSYNQAQPSNLLQGGQLENTQKTSLTDSDTGKVYELSANDIEDIEGEAYSNMSGSDKQENKMVGKLVMGLIIIYGMMYLLSNRKMK